MARFGVFDFLASINSFTTERVTVSRLVEEMISFLILLVTEIPLPGYESPADRVKIMLRRELVHKLVGGPCTYSELQECMGLIPESEKVKSSVFDSVIEAIAEWQEGTALEPSKLRLREAAWAEYDPSFSHASNRTHQIAMETRPKLKYAQPMAPPPPPAHPAFVALRLTMLCDPILLEIARDLVYAFAASRLPSSPAFAAVKSQWEMQCSTSCFVKVLQLLTLVMHNAFSKEQAPSAESDAEAESIPSAEERKAFLSTFMLECHNPLGPAAVNQSPLPSMIDVLMDLHDCFNSSGGDSHTVLWLLWIIGKVGELSSDCDRIVDERMSQQLNEKRAIEMKERRDRARAKAMAAMKKSANAFAEHIEGLSDEEDDEQQSEGGGGGQEGLSMECIICRSHESKDVMGFLAFSQVCKTDLL
jgi:hypothetical protein